MPTTVDATGNLAIPLKLTADLVAASATFRTLVGAATASAALADIWEGEAKDESLPRAIIDWSDRIIARVAMTQWNIKGEIAVLIEKEVTFADYTESYQNEGRTFRNEMGAIESEMLSALIASPHLYPNVTEIVGPWVNLPDSDERDGKLIMQGWLGLMVEGSAL